MGDKFLPDAGVIELRQYTLHPGRRETLIELFEREFIESQQACGIELPGLFRDLDRPDRFVWLRAFADMADRARALAAFYEGPVWRAHREAANATMIDSDNVLLLRPAGQALQVDPVTSGSGSIVVGICPLAVPTADSALLQPLLNACATLLQAQGVQLLATWASERSANNFPRLPLREGEPVLVWLARHPAGLDTGSLRSALDEALAPWLGGSTELLRLAPTARSPLQA